LGSEAVMTDQSMVPPANGLGRTLCGQVPKFVFTKPSKNSRGIGIHTW
jgi:hypothetical protein